MASTKKASSAGKGTGPGSSRAASHRPAAKAAKAPARKAVAAKTKPVPKVTKKASAKAVVKAPVKPAPKPAVKAPPKPAPKAEPPKAAKPAPKRKGNLAGLSPKDLEAIKAELNANRATLEKEFEDLEIGSLHVAQSELSGEVSFDEEYADAGTFTFERERDLSLSNNIRDLMDKVDTALRRLADGTYGTCERCGRAIDKARLKALPYSVLCISCKQREERIR